MRIEIKDGVVTNDGAVIGTIEDGTCFLKKKVGPTVKGAIKKEAAMSELAFVVGETPDEDADDAPKPSLATMSDDELAAEMKRRGLIQDAPDVPTPAFAIVSQVEADKPAPGIGAVARLHDLAAKGQIPQPPSKNPAMGDKTPEYVAWFKTHATPEEIAARYPDNRRVPASTAEFAAAQEKLQGKLKGEKKDTGKENDFNDNAE